MKINELKERLEVYKELENKMYFGRASDNKNCIMQENNKWIVFYYERGMRVALKEFEDEESACEYFYIKLIKYIEPSKNKEIKIYYRFLNKEIPLRISFDVFDGEEITLLQNKAYTQFIYNIKEIFAKSFNELKKYCGKNYNIELNEMSFYKYIMPKQIYIKRESKGQEYCKFALLCNFKLDLDNGLAIVWNKSDVKVGPQDIIL